MALALEGAVHVDAIPVGAHAVLQTFVVIWNRAAVCKLLGTTGHTERVASQQ